jgi:hypothetical protein
MSLSASETDALAPFLRAHAAGLAAHAYVVLGDPSGAGGRLARAMVQALLCGRPDAEGRACGVCRDCELIAARSHPNTRWIEPLSKSRIIDADAVRDEALPFIARTAYAGGWKALVIEHADRLNTASANILLKTLEEPPERTIILLVTAAPESLLPTVRSRCQALKAGDAGEEGIGIWGARALEIFAAASTAGVSERLAAAARMAGLYDEIKAEVEPAVEAEEERDRATGAPEWTKEQRLARTSARALALHQQVLTAALDWPRDVLWLASGGEPARLRHPAHADALARQAAALGYDNAWALCERAREAVRRFDRNMTPASVWTAFFLGGK